MSAEKLIVIRAYPRLHVGLMDLGRATPRAFGGAGFSLSGPELRVVARRRGDGAITLAGEESLDLRGRDDAQQALSRFQSLVPAVGMSLTVESMLPQHIGLGSKTALLLALLEGAFRAADLPSCKKILQQLSHRGGVSGIGVHSFFEGGFIVDAGHHIDETASFSPSSAGPPIAIPPVLCRTRIPPMWTFHLVLPRGSKFESGKEREFFQRATPIPQIEVWESISWLYHGVLPAVVTGDLALLRSSLAGIHSVGFKRREVEAQGDAVREVLLEVSDLESCAVGMSSMGPLIYVVSSRNDNGVRTALLDISARTNCCFLGSYRGRNQGREIEQ